MISANFELFGISKILLFHSHYNKAKIAQDLHFVIHQPNTVAATLKFARLFIFKYAHFISGQQKLFWKKVNSRFPLVLFNVALYNQKYLVVYRVDETIFEATPEVNTMSIECIIKD